MYILHYREESPLHTIKFHDAMHFQDRAHTFRATYDL